MLSICTKQKFEGKKKRKGLLPFTPHKLAEELGAYIRTNKREPIVIGDSLINWGCTAITALHKHTTIINHPAAVANSVDKVETHRLLSQNNIPTLEYTCSKATATLWMEEAKTAGYNGWIICRQLSRSSFGKGIVVAKEADEIVNATFYTKYFFKQKEFRYHIFNGKVIDVQQKKRLSSEELENRGFSERPSSLVRNLENGYIFARDGVESIKELEEISRSSVSALGLFFGAVDILHREDDEGNTKSVVCEVNSAPGLTGTTFDIYVKHFREYYENL